MGGQDFPDLVRRVSFGDRPEVEAHSGLSQKNGLFVHIHLDFLEIDEGESIFYFIIGRNFGVIGADIPKFD